MRSILNNKKLIIILSIFLILIIGVTCFFLFFNHHSDKDVKNNGANDKRKRDNQEETSHINSNFPKCPKDLSGILTHSFVDPDTISALIPLGNSNPTSHTFPVDHVYYNSYYESGSIPKLVFYSPANSTITTIQKTISYDFDGKLRGTSYAVTFTLCDGLTVVSGGVIEIMPKLEEEIKNIKGKCSTRVGKHEGEGSFTQCSYDLNYTVKSGEQVGWTGVDEFPEVWAYNYNVKGDSNINWSLYEYNGYQYAFCLFDLYKGDLKNEFYSKFGERIKITTKDKDGKVIQESYKVVSRTVEPRCGVVNQYVWGSVQGDWFYLLEGTNNLEFSGKGLSLIHDNRDPVLGKFSIGGTIIPGAGLLTFLPKHSGYINREFSEVTADNHTYCYQYDLTNDSNAHASDFYLNTVFKKIVLQLIDDHHLRIEVKTGECSNNEVFTNPYNYGR